VLLSEDNRDARVGGMPVSLEVEEEVAYPKDVAHKLHRGAPWPGSGMTDVASTCGWFGGHLSAKWQVWKAAGCSVMVLSWIHHRHHLQPMTEVPKIYKPNSRQCSKHHGVH
jgi:hypothetical protein